MFARFDELTEQWARGVTEKVVEFQPHKTGPRFVLEAVVYEVLGGRTFGGERNHIHELAAGWC